MLSGNSNKIGYVRICVKLLIPLVVGELVLMEGIQC